MTIKLRRSFSLKVMLLSLNLPVAGVVAGVSGLAASTPDGVRFTDVASTST